MTRPCQATTMMCEFERRQISPDRTEEVVQGSLLLWKVSGMYAAMVRIGQKLTIRGADLYINTYSPQEIADHVCESIHA